VADADKEYSAEAETLTLTISLLFTNQEVLVKAQLFMLYIHPTIDIADGEFIQFTAIAFEVITADNSAAVTGVNENAFGWVSLGAVKAKYEK
jgi:hypothetical protein